MTKALAKVTTPPQTSIAGYDQEQIDIIRNVVAPDLKDDRELAFFLHQAQRTGLDPISRQIYAFKSGGKVNIGAYIDGLRLIADRTGLYAPGRDTIFEYDDKGRLVSAKAFVRKWVPAANQWVETGETAYMDEFAGGTPVWKKMPRVMISKCAESRAIKRAFPAETADLHIDAEEHLVRENSQKVNTPNSKFQGAINASATKAIEVKAEVVEEDSSPPDNNEQKYKQIKKETWDVAIALCGSTADAEKKLRKMSAELGYVLEKMTLEQLTEIYDKLSAIAEERG